MTNPTTLAAPLAAADDCCPVVVREHVVVEEVAALSRAFKALGDPTRLRLLASIGGHPGDSACVCDLTEPLGLSQSTVSHHLKVLREAGLIEGERRGTWVHYRLLPGALRELGAALSDAANHALPGEPSS
ncbi:ArsR/SmtB family transcription factor [Georgenia sp. Z1491]|uniref:ArsR/SmtB family transcription factor n=1 Tax=Georgenia sp. Z1491 TaxID=3416707 RepID=UPI003CF57D8D